MAVIKPIKGIRYSMKKVSNLADVITPPYDVISQEEQDVLYNSNTFNIIRLEKPKEEENDTEESNKYIRAKEQYEKWLSDEVLNFEAEPSIYVYEQQFNLDNKLLVREGIICGVKVEPYKNKTILPHEETLLKPKEDRLNLLRHCKANFSSIFGLYPDTEMSVSALLSEYKQSPPDIEFKDKQGQVHKVWVISKEKTIQDLTKLMDSKQIFIADGHHRYETALKFHEEMKNKKGSHEFVMMTLVNLYDPGLLILPTHRLVRNLQIINPKDLIDSLEKDFFVKELEFSPDKICKEGLQLLQKAGDKSTSIGLFLGEGTFYILTMKSKRNGDKYDNLDVVILQDLIFEKILGIDAEKRRLEENLSYTRDCSEALMEVENGSYQIAFLMNPTKKEEVTEAAAAGLKMPQKSTYFYPKLITGLVINPID